MKTGSRALILAVCGDAELSWNVFAPSAEASELPHFSSPHLVSRFALVEKLDFLFYLRHGRPSFAYATFLIQDLSGCSDISLR